MFVFPYLCPTRGILLFLDAFSSAQVQFAISECVDLNVEFSLLLKIQTCPNAQFLVPLNLVSFLRTQRFLAPVDQSDTEVSVFSDFTNFRLT